MPIPRCASLRGYSASFPPETRRPYLMTPETLETLETLLTLLTLLTLRTLLTLQTYVRYYLERVFVVKTRIEHMFATSHD